MMQLNTHRSIEMFVFHIATEADWRAARLAGAYTTSTVGLTLEQEGFIHLSRDSQAAAVLSRYYSDVHEALTLLVVDTELLTAPWQFDKIPGAELSFPHVYGPLNCSAVVEAQPLMRGAAGQWQLPTLPASI